MLRAGHDWLRAFLTRLAASSLIESDLLARRIKSSNALMRSATAGTKSKSTMDAGSPCCWARTASGCCCCCRPELRFQLEVEILMILVNYYFRRYLKQNVRISKCLLQHKLPVSSVTDSIRHWNGHGTDASNSSSSSSSSFLSPSLSRSEQTPPPHPASVRLCNLPTGCVIQVWRPGSCHVPFNASMLWSCLLRRRVVDPTLHGTDTSVRTSSSLYPFTPQRRRRRPPIYFEKKSENGSSAPFSI